MGDNPDPDPTTASQILDIKAGELARFDAVPDLFNPPNTLSGWLCRRGDHRYGALVIEEVNGQALDVPHLVLGTPKQHYPFGRSEDEERRYHWPMAIKQAVAWEKLDGTNILGYCYPDATGTWFVTYKTRLTPTLRASSTHGDFFGLWSEVIGLDLADPMDMDSYIMPGMALSFELWGHRNHHLISYTETLQGSLLFGVEQHTGALVPPDDKRFAGLIRPGRLAVSDGREGLTKFYEEIRATCGAKNKAIDDDHMEGTEGAVLYLEDEDGLWTQWKCKPESIEALHWAGDFLPMSVILPTAWNVLESADELTVEAVNELLAEEFSPAMIRNSIARIQKAVARVIVRIVWQDRVRNAYADTGLDWATDGRGAVMRTMSLSFKGPEMREVFNALRELGIAADTLAAC